MFCLFDHTRYEKDMAISDYIVMSFFVKKILYFADVNNRVAGVLLMAAGKTGKVNET